jgi:hypothetical protein
LTGRRKQALGHVYRDPRGCDGVSVAADQGSSTSIVATPMCSASPVELRARGRGVARAREADARGEKEDEATARSHGDRHSSSGKVMGNYVAGVRSRAMRTAIRAIWKIS